MTKIKMNALTVNLQGQYKEEDCDFGYEVTPQNGKPITHSAAVAMIKDLWKGVFGRTTTGDDSALDENASITFDKQHIQLLLSQKGCEKLRFYFCKNPQGKNSLVISGVDCDDNDLNYATKDKGSLMSFPPSKSNQLVQEKSVLLELGEPTTFRDYISIKKNKNKSDEATTFQNNLASIIEKYMNDFS